MTAFDRTIFEEVSQGQPEWRAAQMTDAYTSFDSQELPTGLEEEWRYVDLHFDLAGLTPSTTPGDTMEPDSFLAAALAESAGRVTIVDGVVVDATVDSSDLSIRRVKETDRFLPAAPVDRDKFAAAHTAFATDGVRIDGRPGSVGDRPVVVDVQATREGVMSFPHIEFAAGANAEASVVVVYRSPEELSAVVVPGVYLSADEGGRLRFVSVQRWGQATTGLVHERLNLGRDATGRVGEVGLGARVGRLDLAVDLEGAGSSCEVVGLYFGENEQTLDYRLVINHIGRNTSSDVFLKGAVEDHAQSIFTGLLRIEEDAVRSSAFETNRNLVLSENAKAHSVPNLEILCNDVVCGHGSSVGPLEEEHLYYLQSRGISRPRAERMLIRGFFTEVIDRLPIDIVADPVQQAVFRRFARAQEEGRLS
ncbi:MAG TPA: Fe-S cluster assembly protein SufD [Acidimicrobiia bacterium]|nr:Fe-S cluster assembly protein SufD [Acidimicrobiia bacterium]